MSIVASELLLYAAASRPTDDVGVTGGAIDTLAKLEFVADLPASGVITVEALSSSGADTMSTTVWARNAAGQIISETKLLTGATPIIYSVLGANVERVEKMTLASAPAGTITLRVSAAGATILQIPIGKTSVTRMFYDAASAAGVTVRHEKCFWKNENATLTLTNAVVQLTADPSAIIQIATSTVVNDTNTIANRLATPAAQINAFVDDNINAAVPANALAAAAAIGVWVKMTLAGGAAALRSSFTLTLSGTTT
jgi:hypothetical protein